MADPNDTGFDEHFVESPFKNRRNIALTAVVFLIIAGVVYTAWWYWLAAEVRQRVDAWIDAMRLDGREAAYEQLVVEGYPGTLAIRIAGIDAADPQGGWRLHVPALNALMKPWTIDRIDGAAAGPVALDLSRGAVPGRYTVSAGTNAFRLDPTGGGRIRAEVSSLRVEREGAPDPLTAENVTATLIRGALPVYGRATLEARAIDLPPEMHSAFGGDIAGVRITAEATGAELPEGISAAALRRWTENGGAIDVKSLEVHHGVLGLTGEGTLALDGGLQPIGAFTARISGFNDAVDALVEAGAARPQDGALAKVVLGVLAKAPPGGGPKVVSLPLSLQDRRLSVGPVPLITLKRIDWE
jgi:hypothetical protein